MSLKDKLKIEPMKAKTENYINKIVAYFKSQPILRAWLFGSYSRGDETEESDIDILVDYDNESPLSHANMQDDYRPRGCSA